MRYWSIRLHQYYPSNLCDITVLELSVDKDILLANDGILIKEEYLKKPVNCSEIDSKGKRTNNVL